MTELPPELQHIGVGARTFKKRSGPEKGDRSIWTDTPADAERKATVGKANDCHSCLTSITYLFAVFFKFLIKPSLSFVLNNRNVSRERKGARLRKILPHKSLKRIWRWQTRSLNIM